MPAADEFFVICDNIRSLENIGSIFRTADAIGVTKIFLCGISGKAPVGEDQAVYIQRKIGTQISKTALGAQNHVPFEYYSQTGRLIDKLKKQGVTVVALEQDKKSILYSKLKPKFPLALLLGNEVTGISKKLLQKADAIIELPMHGSKESLNVSVAFGVAGYYLRQSRL